MYLVLYLKWQSHHFCNISALKEIKRNGTYEIRNGSFGVAWKIKYLYSLVFTTFKLKIQKWTPHLMRLH